MLSEILILLTAAVVVVALFRRLHLPAILGYLMVGVLVGPAGLGLVEESEHIHILSELGVVFLLFTIGLELSIPQLLAMRGVVLGVGGAQVGLTTAVVALLAWLLGLSWQGAVIAGGLLAMSSTAVVVKQLTEQVELGTRHGRMALGVLLFQDIAVIPFLILIPVLGGGAEGSLWASLGEALLRGLVAVAVLLAAGHWLLRRLFREVARARSAELFTLTVLLVSIAAAAGTYAMGLSLALGAFLAGMMLAETEYRHQIESDIRPFQDVLLGLFFVSVGMRLDLWALPAVLHWVVLGLLALIIGKALLTMAIAMLAGAQRCVAMRTGLALAQGGEFGFVLLALARGAGLVDEQTGTVLLATVLLSMVAAPFILRHNGLIAKHYCGLGYRSDLRSLEQEVSASAQALDRHVIICGFGRLGQNIARLLEREGFSWLALDLDPTLIAEARAAGERVGYGDATRKEILQAAGIERARLVVITADETHFALKLLGQLRRLKPELPVLVRTQDEAHLEDLRRAGATEVVPEALEGSLMMAAHVLLMLEVPGARVVKDMRAVWADRYQMLRGFFHGVSHESVDASEAFSERLHAVALPPEARAVGRSLAELGLEAHGVRLDCLRRGENRHPEASPGEILQPEDVLVLYGTPEALGRAEEALLQR